MPTVRDLLITAAEQRGCTTEPVQDSDTFCRLLLHGTEDLLIDLAVASAPGWPPTASIAGPTC